MLHRRVLCLACGLMVIAQFGCASIIRSSIDTQPRVRVSVGQLTDDPASVVHGRPVAYAVGDVSGDLDPDLVRLSPVIVQGFQPNEQDADYDIASDAIGLPVLSSDETRITIDTEHPVVFARIEYADFGGQQLKQCVYAFWYPERPVGSIETGSIDGGILRITLDGNGTPAVFEYSQPCGCFHGAFVSSAVEAAARREFGAIENDRYYAVEQPLSEGDSWVVRGLVNVREDSHPVLYMTAGKHFCEAIAFTSDTSTLALPRLYDMAPYEALESIPKAGGGTGSMFNEHGLVPGAKRWKEELLLADLNNPGWPRHLNVMLIHWDQDRWNDPTLLKKRLKLPTALASGLPVQESVSIQATGSSRRQPVFVTDKPRLLVFVHSACAGCEVVRRDVLTDARVQRSLDEVALDVIDTSTTEGMATASRYHISMTPTAVLLDQDGREMRRTEDIDSAAKAIQFINTRAASTGWDS